MRRAIFTLCLVNLTFGLAEACPFCRTSTGEEVRNGIFNDAFLVTMAQAVAPFVVFAAAVKGLHGPAAPRATSAWQRRRPLLSAGLCLGLGLGGFFDGIVFHQLLQAHNMMSGVRFPDSIASAEINMWWDGVFHAGCFALVCTGLALLWQSALRSPALLDTRLLVGSLLAGGGLFNAVEGLLNHQLFGLHHVVERAQGGSQLAGDLAFLGSGAALLVAGVWLARGSDAAARSSADRKSR